MFKPKFQVGDLLLEKYDTLWMITEIIKLKGTQEICVKSVNRPDLDGSIHGCRFSFYINVLRKGIKDGRFKHYPVGRANEEKERETL
jgi:predicted nucleotide-binding protein (sugar kinase/HSP70/actin superfamily)